VPFLLRLAVGLLGVMTGTSAIESKRGRRTPLKTTKTGSPSVDGTSRGRRLLRLAVGLLDVVTGTSAIGRLLRLAVELLDVVTGTSAIERLLRLAVELLDVVTGTSAMGDPKPQGS
jgi:hypothetical protein